MDALIFCWFIIESVLIPQGFTKWYSLGFFINPFMLVLSQIFLWVKSLVVLLFVLLCSPIRITWVVIRFVFLSLKDIVASLLSVFIFDEVPPVVLDDHATSEICAWEELPIECVTSYGCYRVPLITCESEIVIDNPKSVFMAEDTDMLSAVESDNDEVIKEDVCHDIPVEDTVSYGHYQAPSNVYEPDIVFEDQRNELGMESGDKEEFMDYKFENFETYESSALVWSSRSLDFEGAVVDESEEDMTDEFQKAYIERMSWFDILYYDRGALLSAISGNSESSPFTIPLTPWIGEPIRKLIQSVERDFEMIYVGQLCLGWEALHYQYRKVESLASSAEKGAFFGNVAGKFQKFQILLERFTENDKCEGRRVWNYVHNRSSFKSLLQVPEVSGYVKEGTDRRKGEAMRAEELLKAIEKSINAFWFFLVTDNKKKSFWKLKNLPWTFSKVEDPRDLVLLSNLNKALKKKEQGMKDMQRKRRWSLMRSHSIEESQRMDILFSMIDMKIVSRVLKIPMLTTNQLNWCQEKLNHIEFMEGKVVRANTSILFPS